MGNINNMAGIGFEVEAAKSIVGTSAVAATAAGTLQTDAYALAAEATIFTTVASGAGTVLPASLPVGSEIRIYNAGAYALNIYPPTGGYINKSAINAAASLPSGEGAIIARLSSTKFGACGITDLTGTEQEYLDGVTAGTVTASKAIVVGASKEVSALGKVTLGTATAGLLLGAGAVGARHALGATAGNGVELYFNATHTSGDMRGIYAGITFSGASGSGETIRANSIVNGVTAAVGGTVNGAHIGIDFVGANAKISGAGNALRATFAISDANSTTVGGTCSVIQCDTWMDTAITVPSGFSFIRFTNTGVKVPANLFRVPNAINGLGLLFSAHSNQDMTHSFRVVSENGTVYYLMATTTATGRA